MHGRTVNELAQHVGGRVIGDASSPISSVASLEAAEPGQLSFFANSRYKKLLASTRATAVVVEEPTDCQATQIVVKNPYYAFRQIAVLLHGHRQHKACGISSRAIVNSSAKIGSGTDVHDFVTISEQARVGQRCVIYPGVFIGPGVEIGDDCILYSNVVIYDGVRIGHRVIIQANSTIGGDGFGYATDQGIHHKIPDLKHVVLEDDVGIGANCTIERGALADTVIGQGAKIGNLVIVGHGVRVGSGCLLVSQVGIAGSTILGEYCVLAGQVGVAGHLRIGDRVTVGAQGGVAGDLEDGATVWGSPAFDMKDALRAYALIKSLPEFRNTLLELERRVADLESPTAKPTSA